MRSLLRSVHRAFFLLLCSFGVAQADGPYDLLPELVKNQELSGLSGQLVWWSNPRTNAAGDVLFDGRTRVGSSRAEASGVFLKRNGAIRKVLLVGDELPDGAGQASAAAIVTELSENGAVAIVHRTQGVLRYDDGVLRWLVRTGALVPGRSLSIETFRGVTGFSDYYTRPLLLEGNRVVFQAGLSDNSSGLFLADDNGIQPIALGGDKVPGRAIEMGSSFSVSEGAASGGAAVFRLYANLSSQADPVHGIFLVKDGTLTTIALSGDTVQGGYRIQSINEFDVNSQGLVVLAAELEKDLQSEQRILTWSVGDGFRTVVDKESLFPGSDSGSPSFFTHLTLTEAGSFAFITDLAGRSGIYVFDNGKIEKIVADGDPSPLGGQFYLIRTDWIPIPEGPPPPIRFMYDLAATRDLDLAFTANVLGTDQGRAVFLWSRSVLAPIPLQDQVIQGLDSLLLESLKIGHLATGPRLLLDATCYSNRAEALVSAAPAQPRVSYLPLVAWGTAGSLGYHTQLSLTNHSRFAGTVRLDWFSRSGQQLRGAAYPEHVSLAPGQVMRVNPLSSGSPMQTGYVKLTVEDGARISADAALELRDGSSAISRANIASTQPATLADLPVDAGSGRTAVAVTNTERSPVRAVMQLLDEEGHSVGVETIDFWAPGQSSFMLEDLFGALPPVFRGRLRVQSTAPVLSASLRLHDVESSSLPVFQQPQHRARKWGYENVYPSRPWRSMLSPAGTFAYMTTDQRLYVIKEGRVYLPLQAEEARSKISPGAGGDLIGFWREDELLFEASEADGSRAIFSWRPGQLIRLFGTPQVLPDGRRITVASYYHESHGTKSAIGASEDDLLFLASEEAPDKSRCTAIYRYDGDLQRCAVLPASVSWLPDVRSFDRRGEYAVFIGNYSRPQLWLYGNGELRMLTEAWATVLPSMRVRYLVDARVTSGGQVFFSAGLENWVNLELCPGVFRFEGRRVKPVLMRGDSIQGLPGFTADFFDFYVPDEVFRINANDRVLIKTQAKGTVFLEAASTTAAPALLYPTAEMLEAGGHHVGAFEWTDADALVFVGLQYLGHNLQVWRNGELETILGNADTLATFRNQPPSVVDSIRTVWASSSGHIFFDASTAGGEPRGIWQVLPDNHRSYFLPVLPDLAEGGISYRSSMSIQNRGQEESRVQVTSIAPDGREAGVQHFRLSAGETRTIDTDQGGAFSGWARVAVEGGDTTVTERLTLDLDGHFSQLHLAPATPRRELYLPAAPGWSSDSSSELIGVAIVNPYNAGQDVVIERVGEGLEVTEAVTVTLPASGQRAFYISDLLPGNPEVKMVRIRSTWPVAVTALNWSPLGICLQPVF